MLVRWLLAHRPPLEDLRDSAQAVALFKRDRERSLFLLLALNAYHAKTFLARGHCDPLLDKDLLAAVPDFSRLYCGWQPPRELGKLNLVALGGLFEGPEAEPEGGKNYNLMVGRILELSKSYNTGPPSQPRKKTKLKEQSELASEVLDLTPLY